MAGLAGEKGNVYFFLAALWGLYHFRLHVPLGLHTFFGEPRRT